MGSMIARCKLPSNVVSPKASTEFLPMMKPWYVLAGAKPELSPLLRKVIDAALAEEGPPLHLHKRHVKETRASDMKSNFLLYLFIQWIVLMFFGGFEGTY